MKKSHLILIVITLVLILAIAALAYLNSPRTVIMPGTLTISDGQRDIYTYTMEELKALPYIEIEKEIVSSSAANESGVWRGVALRDVLGVVDQNLLAQAQQVDAYAEDAYVASYSLAEVLESDSVMAVYAKDGADLASRQNGGKGPLRIIVRDDHYGNRCLMYLWKVELR